MSDPSPRPPRWAERLLGRLFPPAERDAVRDDFRESFARMATDRGPGRARRWYLVQLAKILRGKVFNVLFWSLPMLKNYLVIAIRNLKKQKGISFINIAGLALGMACCLLMVLYIRDERSYDAFHADADRIFRVVTGIPAGGGPTNANGTFGTGPALAREFPEVEAALRIRAVGHDGIRVFVGHADRKFYEDGFIFADPNLFTFFSFPLRRGDPATVLTEPGSIVITERMAARYFGLADPLGRTLEADPYNSGEHMTFRVTGVAADVPANSHFHFDFAAAYVNQRENLDRFDGLFSNYTYVRLQDVAQAAGLQARLPGFVERHFGADPWYGNHLQPLRDIRLYSGLRAELEPTGSIFYVLIFAAVAGLVLVIAAINYINLATARSLKRANEVGVRKVVGAGRRQLMVQFLGESLLVSLLGGAAAAGLTVLVLPLFNALADKAVTARFLLATGPLAALAGIVAAVGLLSGGYVAVVLSGMSPLQVLQGRHRPRGGAKLLREGLVVFQFFLGTLMIIGALTAHQQLRFIQNHHTGYDRDEILAIPLNRVARAAYPALRDELLACPAIRNTTTSAYVPTRGVMHEAASFEGREERITPVIYSVGEHFLDTFGIRVLHGTGFTRPSPDLENMELLVSEYTLTEAGYTGAAEALGKRVEWWDGTGNFGGAIVGIVNDLNLFSFHRPAYPIVLQPAPVSQHDYLSVRFVAGRAGEALAAIETTWKRQIPEYPLDYFFLDESFAALHRADQRLGAIFHYFSVIAVAVACMGLFGLAVFAAEQRTKEMGIRKTLGATLGGICGLLLKSFTRRIVLASLLAWPVAWLLLREWLAGFAYRVALNAWTFVAASLVSIAVALLTVSWQSVKAARTRPIDSLRYE